MLSDTPTIAEVLRLLLPKPSPLQLAICAAADGLPVELPPDELELYFGCVALAPERPKIVEVIGGVRGGKSMIAISAGISGSLGVNMKGVRPHELPRLAIVGPSIDAASATFGQLVEVFRTTELADLLESETADSIIIRRPSDGRRAEITVVAQNRGAVSIRNRWLLGFIYEEVAFSQSEASGAIVNPETMARTASTRLLPGAQSWYITSPNGPEGLAHATYKRFFGKPGRTLVIHAPTRALNPTFPQSAIDEVRREDPDTAAREHDALFLDAEAALLAGSIVDGATRTEPLVRQPPPGVRCVAAMDGATRGNSWTLCVGWAERVRNAPSRVIVAGAWQWTGSKTRPLSPRAVLAEIATLLEPYGVRTVSTDQWSIDALRDLARDVALELREDADAQAAYQRLRAALASGSVELPPGPPQLRTDLLAAKRRATGGGVRVELPRTADGRHCDFVPSVARVVERLSRDAADAVVRVLRRRAEGERVTHSQRAQPELMIPADAQVETVGDDAPVTFVGAFDRVVAVRGRKPSPWRSARAKWQGAKPPIWGPGKGMY